MTIPVDPNDFYSFPMPWRPTKNLTDSAGKVLRSEQEESPIDPLDQARDSAQVMQRQIVLGLQNRLADMVEMECDIDDILSASQAIAINLQINDDILDVF
jgi:hypothetical protein